MLNTNSNIFQNTTKHNILCNVKYSDYVVCVGGDCCMSVDVFGFEVTLLMKLAGDKFDSFLVVFASCSFHQNFQREQQRVALIFRKTDLQIHFLDLLFKDIFLVEE